MWVHKVSQEVSRAVGVPAAVGSGEQEAALSKNLCPLPAVLPYLTTGLEVSTHLVAEAGMGWRHGGIEDMHLLQLHVTVELLQLRGLHTLQLREVILREALEFAVYMMCGEIPVMICRDSQGGGVSQGARAGHNNTKQSLRLSQTFTLISS